jgi:hypothetical protein
LDQRRAEVAGGWRRLHNEYLHTLYTSPDIIRVIKSWRIEWVGHTARKGEMRNAYNVLVVKHEGKRPLVDLSVDGRIILEWISRKQCGKVWTGCIWLRKGSSGRLL